jgi:cysteinyl-tRNA synthetase
MHAGAVRVDGEKMSKSLGNFFTIREILDKYPAEVVRFLLLSSQYRSAINYSEDSLKEAQSKLERFYNTLAGVEVGAVADIANEYSERFHLAMDDDFNTPEAIAVLFDLSRTINKTTGDEQAELAGQLRYLGSVLGCLQSDAQAFLQGGGADGEHEWIAAMIVKRADAKKAKDFATADAVRDELLAKGIVLRDSPEGTTWSRQ